MLNKHIEYIIVVIRNMHFVSFVVLDIRKSDLGGYWHPCIFAAEQKRTCTSTCVLCVWYVCVSVTPTAAKSQASTTTENPEKYCMGIHAYTRTNRQRGITINVQMDSVAAVLLEYVRRAFHWP